MRRFKRTFRRGSKRSVSWEAVTLSQTDGDLDRDTFALIPVAGTKGAQAMLQLLGPEGLQSHGGEDAVITRVVGDLHIIGGRKNSVATSAFIHFSIIQAQSNSTTGLIEPQSMFVAGDAAKDNILYDETLWCPALPVAAPTALQPWKVSTHIDVRARRKIQEENYIYAVFGSAGGAGNTIIDEVTVAGTFRFLMKRPR